MMDWYHGDWGYAGIAGMAMMVALWGVIIAGVGVLAGWW